MILDTEIRNQLAEYLKLLEGEVLIKVSAGADSVSKDVLSLVEELKALSPKIKSEEVKLPRTPSFSINRIDQDMGITFAGVPLGHEFTSLVLALLQVSGRPPKVDDNIVRQIKNIDAKLNFETYVSLSCQNCPEVVQALNIMSVLNPNITHTMIDGAAFRDEVESKEIMAVPAIYLNGEFFGSGRMTIEKILSKLDVEVADKSQFENKDPFDVLVIGAGPAGAAAAVYAARKGIRTGIVAERFGGQVNDTMGIENLISVKYTEGPKLASALEEHVREYNVDIIYPHRVKHIDKKDMIEVELENGAVLKSKTVIIATGARWRNVNVPGEAEFKNK